jgi:hypothetical protein
MGSRTGGVVDASFDSAYPSNRDVQSAASRIERALAALDLAARWFMDVRFIDELETIRTTAGGLSREQRQKQLRGHGQILGFRGIVGISSCLVELETCGDIGGQSLVVRKLEQADGRQEQG